MADGTARTYIIDKIYILNIILREFEQDDSLVKNYRFNGIRNSSLRHKAAGRETHISRPNFTCVNVRNILKFLEDHSIMRLIYTIRK